MDRMLEGFLHILFDESEAVEFGQDPDIIDVEPLSYSTERSSDAPSDNDDRERGEP